MTTTDRRLVTIATGQLGSFTRAQARDAGVSDRQLRSRIQSGFLTQTGPHTFRLAGAVETLTTQLSDLVLDIGQPVWVAGPTAAALHGFDGYALRRPFHLLVPRRRSLHRHDVVSHRATVIDLIDGARVDQLPVTSAVRTLIDLARVEPAAALSAAIDSALRDGLMSERLLHRRIVALRSQGRYGLPMLMEVLDGNEIRRGGHSFLEREYLAMFAGAGLPKPDTQAVLNGDGDRLLRVDCRFPGTPVVVELLGYRWHRSRAQMSHDAARMNSMLSSGLQPYQFTYSQVVTESELVIATTTQALQRWAA